MKVTGTPKNSTLIGKTAIFFLMMGIVVLFGTLSVAFILTPERIDSPFHIPYIFYLNTIILLISSGVLHYAWTSRGTKAIEPYIRHAFLLGVVFLCLQIFGWAQLVHNGIPLTGNNPKMSYLYVLTGLHGFHLVAGVVFLVYILNGYQKKARKHFEIAVFFWHFLGLLWIYLLGLLAMGS